VAGSYALHLARRTVSAAALLSVGIAIKFLPAAALGYYLWKRQFRMVVATCLCTAMIGIVPGVLWFGPHNFAEGWSMWARQRLHDRSPFVVATDRKLTRYTHQSVMATLTRLLTPSNAGRGNVPFQITKIELSTRTVFYAWLVAMTLPLIGWVLLAVTGPRKPGPVMPEALPERRAGRKEGLRRCRGP